MPCFLFNFILSSWFLVVILFFFPPDSCISKDIVSWEPIWYTIQVGPSLPFFIYQDILGFVLTLEPYEQVARCYLKFLWCSRLFLEDGSDIDPGYKPNKFQLHLVCFFIFVCYIDDLLHFPRLPSLAWQNCVMRDLSSLVTQHLIPSHFLTLLWVNNYLMELAALFYSSLSWQFLDTNLQKHWEGGNDIWMRKYCFHIAMCRNVN